MRIMFSVLLVSAMAIGLLCRSSYADFVTFGDDNVDQLLVQGPQIEGDYVYEATVGLGWELQNTFAPAGAALTTFFNVEGAFVGDLVVLARVDGTSFTFDSVEFGTIQDANADDLRISGFLNGGLVETLDLTFETDSGPDGQPFANIAGFRGLIDQLVIEITQVGSNAAILDNIQLTATVPEPGSLIAYSVLVGAIGLVRRRRRQ